MKPAKKKKQRFPTALIFILGVILILFCVDIYIAMTAHP
jgi:hypothetical protein